MKSNLSRRDLMAQGFVVLGAVAACELTGFTGAGYMTGFEALASEGSKEETMPHISVKIWPGRSEEAKQRLADAITEDVVSILGSSESSVSVSIEEISSDDWKEDVYDPEIRGNDHLYKKPGYSM